MDRGNTVVAVEHNIDLIQAADYLIDMGPGGGSDGGRIIACGTLDDIMQCNQSVTGKYFKRGLKMKNEQMKEKFMSILQKYVGADVDIDFEKPLSEYDWSHLMRFS